MVNPSIEAFAKQNQKNPAFLDEMTGLRFNPVDPVILPNKGHR
jgi:hypothetical protein